MKAAGAFVVGVVLAGAIGPVATAAIGVAGALLAAVVGNDLDRNAAKIGVRIARVAALLIPRRERRACVEEWTDDVLAASEDGQGVRPLLKAIGIAVLGAPLLAVLIRYDPQRRGVRR